MSRPKCKDGSLDMRYNVCKESIKECFVCGEELKCTHPPIEIWYRPDDAAHADCVWKAAKLAMYGE